MQEFQNFILRSIYVFSSKERFLVAYAGLALFYLISALLYALASVVGGPTHALLMVSPLFIAIGPVALAVVMVVRSHFFEVSNRPFEIFSKESFLTAFRQIWVPLLTALALFITFWILLFAYHLLTWIPYVGPFVDFFLGFFSFVCTTVLLFYAVAIPILIFVVAPPLALDYDLFRQLRRDNLAFIARSCVTYIGAFFLAVIPLVIVGGIISIANWMVEYQHFSWLTSLFRIILTATYMTPALLFFCGMALETYFLLMKKHQGEVEEETAADKS